MKFMGHYHCHRFTDYNIILFVTNEFSPKFTIKPKGHLDIAR